MNNRFIADELNWLAAVMALRLRLYFGQETEQKEVRDIVPQTLAQGQGRYCDYLMDNGLGFEERLFLILSFVPYLKPQLLDCFNVKNSDTGQRFVEFGCEENTMGCDLKPSLETALFLLAGDRVEERLRLAKFFMSHPLLSSAMFFHEGSGTAFSSWLLQPAEELVDELLLEREFAPHFSTDFSAHRITTARSWSELVLDETTMKLVNEIKLWVEYGDRVRKEWNLEHKVKPGFRALFYGPSGSGKTFTATLLGKATGKEVYRIDLSLVVSKYVGETEKNLSKVFELAEGRSWILFFDEADALFGKRTGLKDAHDRYANQEVAYLLQRIEDYRGLVVLSTNLKSNMDEAFARRFQSVIRFPMPDAAQRERLWRETFSPNCVFEEGLDLKELAAKYEMAGGSILNVVQYASLMAMSRGESLIRKADALEGIRREFQKEGKVMG